MIWLAQYENWTKPVKSSSAESYVLISGGGTLQLVGLAQI